MSSGKKGAAAAGKKPSGKTVAPAPKIASKPKTAAAGGKKRTTWKQAHNHLFPATPRRYGIGKDIRPKTDLTHFVKWPRYIRLQRQRAILKKRLKVPPAINQFTKALEKNQASTLFRLLAHYRPETRVEKSNRLKAQAGQESKGADVKTGPKPLFVKYGLNHVTKLVESKRAKLVMIAHDVDPIELVVWLPALCRKMNVPYVIVKGKARLGHVVHKKTSSVLAVTEVRKEDQAKLDALITNANIQFKDNSTDRKRWGGGIMGQKTQAVLRERARIAAKETKGRH